MGIGIDEWRKEIEQVMGRSSDKGMTTTEIARATKTSHRKACEQLKALHDAGRLAAGRRAITTRDGRQAWTPVYWIKGKKGKGGGR